MGTQSRKEKHKPAKAPVPEKATITEFIRAIETAQRKLAEKQNPKRKK